MDVMLDTEVVMDTITISCSFKLLELLVHDSATEKEG